MSRVRHGRRDTATLKATRGERSAQSMDPFRKERGEVQCKFHRERCIGAAGQAIDGGRRTAGYCLS